MCGCLMEKWEEEEATTPADHWTELLSVTPVPVDSSTLTSISDVLFWLKCKFLLLLILSGLLPWCPFHPTRCEFESSVITDRA